MADPIHFSSYDATGSLEVAITQVPVSRKVSVSYTRRFSATNSPSLSFVSGKTSGRKKTELRLRRVEEERKREAMVAGDTPSGMLQAFARRQEATGEAYMTLSVGNRKSVSAFPLRYLDISS